MKGTRDEKYTHTLCVCVMPPNQRKPWLSLSGFSASPSSTNAWLHNHMTHTPSSELEPELNTHFLTAKAVSHVRADTSLNIEYVHKINTSNYAQIQPGVCIISSALS